VSAEIIDISILLAVKNMSDWRLQNFLWYFTHCKNGQWTGNMRDKLEDACIKEASRRGVNCEGNLKIGE